MKAYIIRRRLKRLGAGPGKIGWGNAAVAWGHKDAVMHWVLRGDKVFEIDLPETGKEIKIPKSVLKAKERPFCPKTKAGSYGTTK